MAKLFTIYFYSKNKYATICRCIFSVSFVKEYNSDKKYGIIFANVKFLDVSQKVII